MVTAPPWPLCPRQSSYHADVGAIGTFFGQGLKLTRGKIMLGFRFKRCWSSASTQARREGLMNPDAGPQDRDSTGRDAGARVSS